MSLIHYFITLLFLGWSPLSYGSAESISLLGSWDQVVVYQFKLLLAFSACFTTQEGALDFCFPWLFQQTPNLFFDKVVLEIRTLKISCTGLPSKHGRAAPS